MILYMLMKMKFFFDCFYMVVWVEYDNKRKYGYLVMDVFKLLVLNKFNFFFFLLKLIG